jgi:uncharacterized protein YecE (DUF72 family)
MGIARDVRLARSESYREPKGVMLALMSPRQGRAFIGISGYAYPEWRGTFYPSGLPAREQLAYAAQRFSTIELDGTFYSLKTPEIFSRWAAAVPAKGFVFAVKGSRYITHMRKLAGVEVALANFYASGVLALGKKTGPFVWQLPSTFHFDAGRLERFLALLPQGAAAAERLAAAHEERLAGRALTRSPAKIRYRHALEIRHPSWLVPACFELCRARDVALVIADTAGKFPVADELTASFVYARLHGSRELYRSGYTEEELRAWADRVRRWTGEGRDAYVYFDNTAEGFAPRDAARLAELVA